MIRPFGEAALLVELASTRAVHALAGTLDHRPIPGVVEAVPGLQTLLVELDPLAADAPAVERELADRVAGLDDAHAAARRDRSIPMVYGGELGPDLDEVAEVAGLTPDEVARRHAATDFKVEILGFAPGFAYLGGLPPELAVPRLSTPRTTTPAGSVAIAGRQTGIYPAQLPGGWRVIGRTPISLFDPLRDPPAYLAPGDHVRFVAIAPDAWDAHAGAPADW